MSSAPDTDADLTVTVKRVQGGVVSNYFLDHVSAGDVLELTKPAGVFCPQGPTRPVVGLCGGSGITPVMSIAKHVLGDERAAGPAALRQPRCVVGHLRGAPWPHCGRTTQAASRCSHHHDSAAGFLGPDDMAGFVGADLDADFYVCGPGPFMDLAETVLAGLGVAIRAHLHRALPGRTAGEGGRRPKRRAVVTRHRRDVPGEVTVILNKKSVVVAYQRGDTLLETARRGGLRPPFSCESGNCATCMAFLKEGSAVMRANNALTPDEVEEGWILTCQGLPRGQTVTVEYEAM